MKDNLFQGKLGFGTAPIGNMYRDIPEEEAMATVDAAWEHGIRYFDSAPFAIRKLLLSVPDGPNFNLEYNLRIGLFERHLQKRLVTE